MKKDFIIIPVVLILFTFCKNDSNIFFNIENFNPITNYSDTIISLDYTDAIDSGFVIPSIRQTANGEFTYKFSIKNDGDKSQPFYYKIFYQNESYKFPETINKSAKENELASENFYGSWEDSTIGFKETPVIPNDNNNYIITGNFRIVGNPRNEKKYFGPETSTNLDSTSNDEEIKNRSKTILNDANWVGLIKEKAKKNNISFDQQLKMDAKYMIDQEKIVKVINNRWKRNPRVGKYSVMLVITTAENIKNKKIPDHIQFINKQKNNRFVNPYYYFSINPDSIKNIIVLKKDNVIQIKAHPDLGKGIYIQSEFFKPGMFDAKSINPRCNASEDMKKNATFSQYTHTLGSDVLLNNLPITIDIFKEEYSINDLKTNVEKYKDKRIVKPVYVSKCPCETVNSDQEKHMISIKNPASKPDEFKKESVGIVSRNGFTYGKFIVKAKLTHLMNKYNVWNGITNAIWLITQSQEEWNSRRICNKEGYLPSYYSTKKDKRVPVISYSEIDFEILKASHRWPITSYKDTNLRPKEDEKYKDKIMVTCTNWDMACWQPKKFGVGVNKIKYDNQVFDIHRWDHWYNAITLKNPQSEEELFGSDYYYFEIEWNPTEIIWKIGPEKNKMRIVGYMNNEVTSIPNNQMVMIITQEFHITRWWPEAPFAQDDIPFPKNEYLGYIYDFEIE